MTLTNRLTLFFLTALAAVLIAFSVAIYGLARIHLFRQVDERATAALETLVAATELEPDGLEWDRKQRSLWESRSDQPTTWAIFDSRGREVDGDPRDVSLLDRYSTTLEREPAILAASLGNGSWQVHRRAFSHPRPDIQERRASPGEPRVAGDERYQTLHYVVAVSLEPLYGILRTIAWSLAAIAAVVWLGAACGGWWFCRRALQPLTAMTATARSVEADDLAVRLPELATGDELEELTSAFNGLLARLQESFEKQRRFTAEASHQLRTPLTAMLGQMEVALRRDRPPEEYRRVLDAAICQARRLRDIVEALLFLARVDNEAQLPGLEVIELGDWLPRHVSQAWSSHPRSSDLRVTSGTGPLPVRVCPTLLGQAVDNVIDNAIKYSRPGAPVQIAIDRAPEGATIAMTDEGPGISAQDAGRVFTPFFRSEEARQRGIAGVGLGLAVTDRILQAFHGRVELRRQPERGTCLLLWLPIVDDRSSLLEHNG